VPTTFRIARLCRPLIFLAFTKPLRLTAARVGRSIPQFADVLVSLALCVIFFVWIGLILFANKSEGKQQFNSFTNAITSIWILFTTANFPDVMIPAYNDNRLTFVFFFVYLVTTLYLLNNVLLATVYDAYKDQLKTSLHRFFSRRQNSIDHAFALMADNDGVIGLEKWRVFFGYYCNGVGDVRTDDPEDRFYNTQRANFVFQHLDTDCDGGLLLEEFRLLVHVFSDMRIPRRRAPRTSRFRLARALQSALTKGVSVGGRVFAWDSFVNVVIFTDMVITLVATVVFVTPLDGGKFEWVWTYSQLWYWVCFSYSSFYFLEVSLKICLLGPERFWNRHVFLHRFDFVVVYSLFFGELFFLTDLVATVAPIEDFMRGLVLLRIIRMLRLVEHVQPLQHLATLLRRLVPVYWNMGMLLVVVYYIFATLGEQLFGGLIKTNGIPAQRLNGTDFANEDYYALNFNDFFSGVVTLFCLMVVNNWYVIANGFVQVTQTYFTVVFFVSFFIMANLVCLNMLIALILDGSSTMHAELAGVGRNLRGSSAESEIAVHFQQEDVMRRMLLADEAFEPYASASTLDPTSTQLPAPKRSVAFENMGGGRHRVRTLSH